ncbi:site-specific integrase [Salipiger sp. H15]|uniref:Site-specific integrase n=1 Tax=Alloyangia sp. H15 TaxID=3029062 RepID=A0AAU8ALU7_9RHOB
MSDVQVRFKGYVPERLPSGAIRHRVRVEGNPKRRIVIPVGPEDPTFSEHYWAARAGHTIEVVEKKSCAPATSLDALIDDYLIALEAKVEGGAASIATLRQRKSLMLRAREVITPEGDRIGSLHCDLPREAMVHVRDHWGARTAQADNCIKALRSAYEWALEKGRVQSNPTAGIRRVHRGRGGAVPWTTQDVKKFLAHHPEGSMPRLWLILALFTGARRGDLTILGRGHEVQREGMTWLDWQPGKKGSAPASLPMAPQLLAATRGMTVQGKTYLLGKQGRPLGSPDVLGNSVSCWTAEAGLSDRSSHGLRKALGGLLGELGCSELQIMSILTHTEPTTSSIYTKSAERRRMAHEAMKMVGGLKLW